MKKTDFKERMIKVKFTELSEKEFTAFEKDHPYGSFYQTIGWGKLKKRNGWNYYLVGLKDSEKIVAGALLLEKKLPMGLSFIYSPRGFLIDYLDEKLLTTFTQEIKKFARKHHAIFVKIDPYVQLRERDIDGNVVENGFDNEKAIENLKKLGFRHNGYTLNMEDLQPRFAFALNLEGKTTEELLKDMESKTRQLIHKNEKNGIITREITIDEVDKFKEIMQHTADRRGFIDRPLSYYKNMLTDLKDGAKIIIAEIDLEDYNQRLKNEISASEKIVKEKEEALSDPTKKINPDKTKKKIEQEQANIKRLTKKLEEGEHLLQKHGKILTLGGIIFMLHGSEILSLFGGSYEEYKDFLSPYSTYFHMIQYGVEHGYKKYNFYGISGDFANKKNELYGLYDLKRGFGGHVEEYLGEFDLVTKPFMYHVYHIAFALYGKVKKWKRKRG